MTTLNQAFRSNDEEVTIAGRLVCKQIFHKEFKVLLVMLIVDADGNSVEAKSWSKTKAYTVFSRFNEGQCVLLEANLKDFVEPNKAYTQAKYETSKGWWLSYIDEDSFRPKNHLYCWTNIEKYQTSNRKPAASVMGLYQDMWEGPPKYWQRRHVAQGYYVKLRDDAGKIFIALVWKSLAKNRAYEFTLDDAEHNDLVLIVNAREQDEEYEDKMPGFFVITTTYPPVVNSNSVSPFSCRAMGA